MAQHPIELILMKQLAGYLALPIFVVDAAGTLVFYNEPAEAVLGYRYDETGEMTIQEWGTVFSPTDDKGDRIPFEDLPLAVALRQRYPAQGAFRVRGLDGVVRSIEVLAVPLDGPGDRRSGAAALFWEQPG